VRLFPLAVGIVVGAAVVFLRKRVGWELKIVGLLVFAALSSYGWGVFDLPNIEHTLEDAGDSLGAWTYPIVGAFAFLETGAFVGLIAPGETAVIAGGVIAGQGNVDIWVLLPLVWLCCVGGDCASFWLGHVKGRGFMVRHGPKVQITEERLVRVEAFFARRGGMTILIGRFIGLVRAIAPFVAGASRMPFRTFLPYDVVGCGLWASAFTLLGYFSWRNIDRAAKIASTGAFVIGLAVGIGLGLWVMKRYLRTKTQRAEARAWVFARLRPSRAP
jgi:membrane protein DedA with SNARE-associated domain